MYTNLIIPQWAEEDRPREKLLLKGKSALSDAELIAIILGSGTRDISAVELAKKLLLSAGNNLNGLARMTVSEITRHNGIGPAKAVSIVAALELGRRRNNTEHPKKYRITSSEDVYQLIKPELLDLLHEEFWVIAMSRANDVLKKIKVSSGGISGTVADPKIIFKQALDSNASAIILVHNHPSGNLKPSEADIRLTRKMKESGNLLELPVLDHIIFSNNEYFSFADEGLL